MLDLDLEALSIADGSLYYQLRPNGRPLYTYSSAITDN
jgi:hypothetical protein